MSVHLREKKLGNGKVSLFLDIYHNKHRWYEFLSIHINKNRPTPQDKEKKHLAQQIRSKREHQLLLDEHHLHDHSKRKADFVSWFEKYLFEKTTNTLYSSTLNNIKEYVGKKPLSFMNITPDWINEFIKHLKTKVSNNTARKYAMVLFSALEEAERKSIIRKNPFRLIDKKDRIKKQEIFRNAYSLEQLQQLANTYYDIDPQIKQAFLFSCFTGLRWSDVNPLRWDEIIIKQIEDKEQWFIYFEQEKTEAIEYIPLSDQAISILKQRMEIREAEKTEAQAQTESDEETMESTETNPYVFPRIKETHVKNRLVQNRVNYSLKRWAEAAGFDPKGMHFHVARHSFATNVLEHSPEGDLWTVSKLLGHRSIISTQIYAHVRDKRKAAAVQSLPTINIPELKVA